MTYAANHKDPSDAYNYWQDGAAGNLSKKTVQTSTRNLFLHTR